MERELTGKVAKKDDREARFVLENLNVSQDQDFFFLSLSKNKVSSVESLSLFLSNNRNKSCNVISVNIFLPQKFYREDFIRIAVLCMSQTNFRNAKNTTIINSYLLFTLLSLVIRTVKFLLDIVAIICSSRIIFYSVISYSDI